MVLPLVDEHNPKCFLCHEGFSNIEDLKNHQHTVHKEYFEIHENNEKREPAPGDVSVF